MAAIEQGWPPTCLVYDTAEVRVRRWCQAQGVFFCFCKPVHTHATLISTGFAGPGSTLLCSSRQPPRPSQQGRLQVGKCLAGRARPPSLASWPRVASGCVEGSRTDLRTCHFPCLVVAVGAYQGRGRPFRRLARSRAPEGSLKLRTLRPSCPFLTLD